MKNIKSKLIGAVVGVGIALGVATTSDAMMIIERLRCSSETHRVQKGENLTQIAKEHRASIGEIIKVNYIKDRDVIRTGDLLTIPMYRYTTPYTREFPPNCSPEEAFHTRY